MRRLLFAAILFLNFFSQSAVATELLVNFSNTQLKGTGSLVWNQALGRLQPPLENNGINDGVTIYNRDIDIGDGRHGIFDTSTYANFSVNGDISGNIIRLDLSKFADLQVTSFHLATNWKIVPVGTSKLIIHSQSDIIIEGQIWCHGDNGGDVVGGALTVAGSGGVGRCGGRRGGNGGAVGGSGGNGESNTGALLPGMGGTYVAPGLGAGGGGGGAYSNDPPTVGASGTNGNTGGVVGQNSPDDGFTEELGSAGGGGGSGSDTVAGAGGGGAGGVILMYSGHNIRLLQDAFIDARGGRGGNNAGDGGGGGAGGGGSILLFAANDLDIDGSVTVVQVNADERAAGTSVGGGAGGNGSQGRTWLSYAAFPGGGSEFPGTNLVTAGTVQYKTGVFTHTSKSFDLQSSLATWTSFASTPTSVDIVLEPAGSANGTDFQFVTPTTLSTLNQNRYFKFRLNVTSMNATNPTVVDAVTFQYTTPDKAPFEFESSCATVLDAGSGAGGSRGTKAPLWITLFLMLLPIGVISQLRLKTRLS